jgi:hypothetical protein
VGLLLLGVNPPTDIERRVREIQRRLAERQGLLTGLALPVLLWLDVQVEPLTAPSLPEGRLEAPRLLPGPIAVEGRWLLWTAQSEQAGWGDWLRHWRSFLGSSEEPERRAPGGPRQLGFPLAHSVDPDLLHAALSGVEPREASPFQPRGVVLCRIVSLQPDRPPPGPLVGPSPTESDPWGRLFRGGLLWEEIARRPLRRLRS